MDSELNKLEKVSLDFLIYLSIILFISIFMCVIIPLVVSCMRCKTKRKECCCIVCQCACPMSDRELNHQGNLEIVTTNQ